MSLFSYLKNVYYFPSRGLHHFEQYKTSNGEGASAMLLVLEVC